MKDKSVSKIFDLVGESFAPDRQAMDAFIKSCFRKDEIENKSILDAGCGTGIASIYFARNKAKKVIGIDISNESINTATGLAKKEHLGNVSFEEGNVLNLRFKDSAFDVIFSVGVLPYVDNIKKAMDEFSRVLSPGGTLLLLSLKKSRWDRVFEVFRKILSLVPTRYIKHCSGVLAFMLKPFSPLILKRKEKKNGKTFQQTFIEAFFSPVQLKKFSAEELCLLLSNANIKTYKFIHHVSNFSSPDTVIVVKAQKKER